MVAKQHSIPSSRVQPRASSVAAAHIVRVQIAFRFLGAAFLLTGCATDYTRAQSGVCEVHHSKMTKSTVPIHYGLFRPDERAGARNAASANAFPHAVEWVGGGCVVGSSKKAVIYTCAECESARQEWEARYDKR